MKKKALYIHGNGYYENDRCVITTLEWLSSEYEINFQYFRSKNIKQGKLFIFRKLFFRAIESLIRIKNPLRYLYLLFQQKPSVVYFMEPRYPMTMGLIRLFFPNTPIILDMRENPATHFIIQNKFLTYLYNNNVISQTFTISREMQTLLSARFNTQVEYFYDLPSKGFISLGNSTKTDSTSPNKPLNLCFFGDIKPDRKIHLVTDALACMGKDVTINFDIYGHVRNEAYLKTLTGSFHNITISYKGVLDYDSSPLTLLKYDCGILTNEFNENSRYTLPGKLWEYLACGLIILSNSRPSVNDIIVENEIGLIFLDQTDLIEKLLLLSRQGPEIRRIKSNVLTFFPKLTSTQDTMKKNLLLNLKPR